MDYEAGDVAGGDYILRKARHFDLAATLDCGQAFRWEQTGEDAFHGVAFGRALTVERKGDDIVLHGVDEAEFMGVWRDYFDLGRDYGELKELFRRDPVLRRAVDFAPGIRVLRQQGWEALCTFIMSQNNNIKRIKGMVERFCALLGEKIPGGYAFPPPQRLAALEPEDISDVRCGFRDRYIIDAAKAVLDGRVSLESISAGPADPGYLSLDDARAALMRIRGVGPKVADCALLYGMGRVECLPVDVWVGRVLENWYPQGLPEFVRPVAGIAQQYLFHYARAQELGKKPVAAR